MAFRTVFCYSPQRTFGQLWSSEALKNILVQIISLLIQSNTHMPQKQRYKSRLQEHQPLCNSPWILLFSLRAFLHLDLKTFCLKPSLPLASVMLQDPTFPLHVDFRRNLIFSSRFFVLVVRILFFLLTFYHFYVNNIRNKHLYLLQPTVTLHNFGRQDEEVGRDLVFFNRVSVDYGRSLSQEAAEFAALQPTCADANPAFLCHGRS